MSSHSGNTSPLGAWARTTRYVFDSATAANRAVVNATGGGSDGNGLKAEDGGEIEAGATLPEWHVELSETQSERLSIGDYVEFSKTITDEDIRSFAAASGDTNPLHLDDEYAEKTPFGQRLTHGVLAGGLISAALARLPGQVVYLSQNFEFHAPTHPEDRLTARIEIVESLGDDQYRLTTTVTEGDDRIIDGGAVVMIESDPVQTES